MVKPAARANMLFVAVSSVLLIELFDDRSNPMRQTFSSPTGHFRLSVEYLGIMGIMQRNMWRWHSPKGKDRGTAGIEWRSCLPRLSNRGGKLQSKCMSRWGENWWHVYSTYSICLYMYMFNYQTPKSEERAVRNFLKCLRTRATTKNSAHVQWLVCW